jgi:hypothetical protein
MKPWEFVLVCRSGSLGVGLFPDHEWHKRERENILASVGLRVEYGEPEEIAKDMGTFKGVTNKEHAEIIRLYTEDNLGMAEIASKLGRSSRTPHLHIRSHNASVERSGFCPSCKSVGSPFQDRKAERAKEG